MHKTYGSSDKGICMGILRGYEFGFNMQRLLQWYWYKHKVVPKYRKFFGIPFRTERGMTQGDPYRPTIFYIVVDAVVRAVLLEVCGTQEEHHGFGC